MEDGEQKRGKTQNHSKKMEEDNPTETATHKDEIMDCCSDFE
jgi:hypothetical protein